MEDASSSAAAAATPPAEPRDRPTLNNASVLRFPFREMSLGWWDKYMRTVRSSDRISTLVNVMDCLMAHAVLHEDPFLEEAISAMNKKLPKSWPRDVTIELINSFEVGHHIFKTICLIAKFPTIKPDEQAGLLNVAEQRIRDIEKAAQQPEMKISRRSSEEVLRVVERLDALRKDPDSRVAYHAAMDQMKYLFFTISVSSGVGPNTDVASDPFDTYVCCEGCVCYGRLRLGPTVFLRDMEKAKIIDCLVICAVKQDNELMGTVATQLLSNHFKDFMDNPALDDIGRLIQNGRFFYCRIALFDALNLVQYLISLPWSSEEMYTEGTSSMYRIAISLLWVKKEVQNVKGLCELVPLLDRTLAMVECVSVRMGGADNVQHLHTLKDFITAAFTVLSASEYHLAVHSRNVFIGKPVDMKCASPACPGTTKDLLKCSGCDITYYCSPDCQKSHWEKHKNFCHEIESRRTKPTPVTPVFGEERCIKPSF